MTWYEIAFQGWVGSMIGAVGAFAAAMYVLRQTLRNEREAFALQLDRERATAIEQVEHERALLREQLDQGRATAREERRTEAFAELAAALLAFRSAPVSEQALADASSSLMLRFNHWAMYVPDEDEAVRRAVGDVCRQVMVRTREAPSLNTKGLRQPLAAEQQEVVRTAIVLLVRRGRNWHRGGTKAALAGEMIVALAEDLAAGRTIRRVSGESKERIPSDDGE